MRTREWYELYLLLVRVLPYTLYVHVYYPAVTIRWRLVRVVNTRANHGSRAVVNTMLNSRSARGKSSAIERVWYWKSYHLLIQLLKHVQMYCKYITAKRVAAIETVKPLAHRTRIRPNHKRAGRVPRTHVNVPTAKLLKERQAVECKPVILVIRLIPMRILGP